MLMKIFKNHSRPSNNDRPEETDWGDSCFAQSLEAAQSHSLAIRCWMKFSRVSNIPGFYLIKRRILKMKTIGAITAVLGLVLTTGLVYGQTGTVQGTVKFAGPVPAMKPYKVTYNENVCGTEASLDRLIVGKDSSVEYAVVYIEGLKGKAERVSPSKYVVEQTDCSYSPHVLVVEDGNAFTVANNDPLFHNVHGYFASNNETAFNIAEPVKGMKIVQKVRKPGMYLMRCDVHPWMNAYIYVAGNGYAAATDKDGKFTLSDVPAGKYKLVMWHEGWDTKDVSGKPEFSEPIEQTQEITVVAGKATTADFTLK
jgi:plastocyanin